MSTRKQSLSGFPELLPAERAAEQELQQALESTFRLWGFSSIETRAVEPLPVLAKGGEIEKELYAVARYGSAAPAELGLRFDLTVPLARYVLENASRLEFPFRRYQAQPVWRGERPQEGRYRQFTQVDVDVVGKETLPFSQELDVVRTMRAALASAASLPPMRFELSNRKLLEGYYEGLGISDPVPVLRAVDKLDKLPRAAIEALLFDLGLTPSQTSSVLALASVEGDSQAIRSGVRALGVATPRMEEGLEELLAMLEACAADNDRGRVRGNLRIARGLDYYTGTVVEVFMEGFPGLGAVGGGGRYDALAADGRTTYPGMGLSFGLSRALYALLAAGALSLRGQSPAQVLVSVLSEETRRDSEAVARTLRARGIPCEVMPTAEKFGRQIRFADRRGIPFVWFGEVEGEVKDIRSGKQQSASASTWTPELS